eukprot:TRINITY_DN639_c0_g1_i6.p1 TRINITY_DN639_c0_g1~~TRINITY_DN639_c0_g1_i6.p1  ORF type:complete len:501 (+),score=148.74 TRINITY_DN639_c0_g1_i6:82-1584(+)
MFSKDVKTAVILTPLEGTWGPIQSIRKVHDKAYERWMPHINMLFPFVPESDFNLAKEKIKDKLQQLTPFTVTLNHISSFNHGNNSTFFVKPKDPQEVEKIRQLQSSLYTLFPHCSDLSTKSAAGFQPHLTLGQVPTSKALQMQKLIQSEWKDIKFEVNFVHLISRSATSPFVFKHSIPIGAETPSSAPHSPSPSPSSSNPTPPAPSPTPSPSRTTAKSSFSPSFTPSPSPVSPSPSPARTKTPASVPSPKPPASDSPSSPPLPTLLYTGVAGGKKETPRDRVREKVEKWIKERNCPQHLPKTKEKLTKAIEKMCRVHCCYGDVITLLQRLKKEGLASFDEPVLPPPALPPFSSSVPPSLFPEAEVKYNKAKINAEKEKIENDNGARNSSYSSSSSLNSSSSFSFTDGEEMFFGKVKEWVCKTKNLPLTLSGLFHSLLQVCSFVVVVSAEDIFSWLFKDKVVVELSEEEEKIEEERERHLEEKYGRRVYGSPIRIKYSFWS